MKLLVTELVGTISQTVVPSKNDNVQAIRVGLYKHNNPAGSFKVEIQNTEGKLVASSNYLSVADISSDAFYHGFIKFDISAHLKKDQEYKIVLTSTGYTFSESAYIGWCNSFDLSSYSPSYEVKNNIYSPLRLEIWSK